LTPRSSHVGGPGAPKIFLVVGPKGACLSSKHGVPPVRGRGGGIFSTKFGQKVRGKSGRIVQQKLRPPGKKLLQIYLLGTREIVVRGVVSRYPLRGRGAAAPNLTQIFDVFRLIVRRSTAAKPNEVEMTFITHFVGRGILKLTCVTDRGYLVG